ncbi:MAG: hypothetical protein ACRD13_01515 [Terriglobales bacterium]
MRFWPRAEIADLKARAESAEALLRRAADDALAAAGARPIWSPDDARYQPRPLAAQMADAQRRKPRGNSRAEFERREHEAAMREARAQLNDAMRRLSLTPREEEAGTEG